MATSILNFLTQGQPQQSNTSTLSTTQVPQYLSDYIYNTLSGAYSAAKEDYQPYSGPRIADFTDPQKQAFDVTKSVAGSYQPQMTAAENTAKAASGLSTLGAAQPYFDAARGNLAAAAGQPAFAGASKIDATGAASPYLTAAGQTNIAGAAQPYMQAAGQTLPGQISNYMNPYQQNVIDQMGTMAAQQLSEKILPQVNDEFTRSGQYGSSRHQEIAQRGARDIANQLEQNIGTQLAKGYDTAGAQAQTDLSRQANLAQTAGQQAQQQGALQANIGQTAGSLANQQMQGLTSLGTAQGNLASADAQRLASIGQAAGTLTGTQEQQGANLANVQAGLGQKEQALGLTGAAALEGIGAEERAKNQANLDLAYQDFQTQTQYPEQQISWLSNIVRGLPSTGGSSSQNTTSSGNTYSASPLASLASGLSSAAALSNIMKVA